MRPNRGSTQFSDRPHEKNQNDPSLSTRIHNAQDGLANDRLRLHDFRFQAGGKGDDFTALRLRHSERVERDR